MLCWKTLSYCFHWAQNGGTPFLLIYVANKQCLKKHIGQYQHKLLLYDKKRHCIYNEKHMQRSALISHVSDNVVTKVWSSCVCLGADTSGDKGELNPLGFKSVSRVQLSSTGLCISVGCSTWHHCAIFASHLKVSRVWHRDEGKESKTVWIKKDTS